MEPLLKWLDYLFTSKMKIFQFFVKNIESYKQKFSCFGQTHPLFILGGIDIFRRNPGIILDMFPTNDRDMIPISAIFPD